LEPTCESPSELGSASALALAATEQLSKPASVIRTVAKSLIAATPFRGAPAETN
jgi:hypothetical protein